MIELINEVCFFFAILDELVRAIANDIVIANRELDSEQCRQYLTDRFFQN